MRSLPFENSFALLGIFLAPVKTPQTLQRLQAAIGAGRIDWGQLLYQANVQLCSPLWYVRLKQDGLLERLPEDLQAYLAELHQANVERNGEFQSALVELLRVFEREGIAAVLLKGAATFCDDLYRDAGARLLRDLDILVPPQHTERCREILLGLGYREVPEPNMAAEGLPTDERHHHLPPFCRPGSPVVVEIHFKVSYGHAGRVLPVADAWENLVTARLDGLRVSVFNPSWRLLHNAAHALVPHCEFIRGEISLLQLAEFSALVHRYGADIDWRCWRERARRQGLGKAFSAYLALAGHLMGLPPSANSPVSTGSRHHLKRILSAGRFLGRLDGPQPAGPDKLTRILLQSYYLLNLPLWVWRNVCYAPGTGNVPARLRCLLKKSMSAASREKI